MPQSNLKTKLIHFIHTADESMLQQLNALIDNDFQEKLSSDYKDILDERWTSHQKNPHSGRAWHKVKISLNKKYDL